MQARSKQVDMPATPIELGLFSWFLLMVRQLFTPTAQPTPISQMSEAAYLLMAGQALSYHKMDVAQRYLAIKAMVQVTDLFSSLLDTPRKEDLTMYRLGLGLEFKAAITSKKSAPIDVPGWNEVDKAALLSTIDMSTAAGIALTEEINLISSQYAKSYPVLLEHWKNVIGLLETADFSLKRNHKRWSTLYPELKSNKEAVDDVFFADGDRIRLRPPIAAPYGIITPLASSTARTATAHFSAGIAQLQTRPAEGSPDTPIARMRSDSSASSSTDLDDATVVGEAEERFNFSPVSTQLSTDSSSTGYFSP